MFDGLRDTLRVLLDAAAKARYEGDISALLAQLEKEMESACNFKPTALAAVRLCLEQLAKHAEEALSMIDSLGHGPESRRISERSGTMVGARF